MIAIAHIVTMLERRYPHLEQVSDKVFRGVDLYEGRPYAIRYFDLSDDLVSVVERLREYQDKLLGASYFNNESKADLRWNHYLYFVVTEPQANDGLRKAKAEVESNREYARKIVVTESDLKALLDDQGFGVELSKGLPPDPLSIWLDILEKQNLGFIIDETLQVPAIIRYITDGERKPVLRAPARPELDAAEKAASTEFLASVTIREFRKYPLHKTFEFGAVNLIIGVNGVGKTSLLEAIEYLFCGKTRRAGSVPPRTSVSGVLADSKLTLQTKTTTSQATLRSRHLVWYGKSELRTVTLHDSFSKFNFLDTDAAVRLSVEKSRERIVDDIAQLLLGAEAAKALDRIERVANQLEDSRKTLESGIAIRDSRRAESLARIQQLRDTPRQSDQLFSDMLLALRGFGWTQQPTDKSQTDQLSASLQETLVNVGLLTSMNEAVSINTEELMTSVQALTAAERMIERLSEEDIARKQEDSRARVRFHELTKRMEILYVLAPIVGAGVGELYRKSQSIERQIGNRISVLAEVKSVTASLPPDKALHQMVLSRAVKEWTDQVRIANELTDNAKKALTAFERTQNILISLQQRLRASAQEIMQHSTDRTHCPLCRAEYSEAELERRFDEATRGLMTFESDRLRSELQTSESLQKTRVLELNALRTLEQYSQGDADKFSVDTAIRIIASEHEHVATLVSELESVRVVLQEHEKKGWTFERMIELSSAISIHESTISSDLIDNMLKTIQDEQKLLFESLQKMEVDSEKSRARIAEIAIDYDLTNPSTAELARAVSKRKQTTKDRLRVIVELRSQVDIDRLNSISELEVRLREAHELTVRLRTAVAKEQQDSDTIARELKLVDDATAEIRGLQVKLRRVDSAVGVIRNMITQQSERVLADEVLHENAENIASTFAKIHAPIEFDLVTNGDLTIVRRTGGKVELDEMSSGQRAAYALSLFLAMNERLTSGPRVLLFDDPVAHVDDINTLSLLDYLRDIALSGHRQIFFATANSKIEALFSRKFNFLGERFKRIELTRD